MEQYMINRLLEQRSAVAAVLMESKKQSDCELVLSPDEIQHLSSSRSFCRDNCDELRRTWYS